MQGIIAISEEREKINAMSDYYQNSYRELLSQQTEIDRRANLQQWNVRIGALSCKFGLLFTDADTRKLGNLGINLSRPVVNWLIKKNARFQKNRVEKEKAKLTAEFIDEKGDSEIFSIKDTDLLENISTDFLSLEQGKIR